MKTPHIISENALTEIADILATGILRGRQRGAAEGSNIAVSEGNFARRKAVDFMKNLRMHGRDREGTDSDA